MSVSEHTTLFPPRIETRERGTDLSPTGDILVDRYCPRTERGRRLLALRRAYILSGGHLLDGNELDAEVRTRRGGATDA